MANIKIKNNPYQIKLELIIVKKIIGTGSSKKNLSSILLNSKQLSRQNNFMVSWRPTG